MLRARVSRFARLWLVYRVSVYRVLFSMTVILMLHWILFTTSVPMPVTCVTYALISALATGKEGWPMKLRFTIINTIKHGVSKLTAWILNQAPSVWYMFYFTVTADAVWYENTTNKIATFCRSLEFPRVGIPHRKKLVRYANFSFHIEMFKTRLFTANNYSLMLTFDES